MGVGTSGLRFGDGETLKATLKAEQGHVSPLSVVNDAAKSVTVLLSKGIAEAAAVV